MQTVKFGTVIPELAECRFRVACDVTNPLCGDQGCSAVFGPQKGATPVMITQMDRWLRHYAKMAEDKYPAADAECAGAGAAGGLGFAFLTFLDAALESGIDIVLEETHMDDCIKKADLIITGEGRIDSQTAMGKAPAGVAKRAKNAGAAVIGIAGCVTDDAYLCNSEGIDAIFPVIDKAMPLEEAMDRSVTVKNIRKEVKQIFRLISIAGKEKQ